MEGQGDAIAALHAALADIRLPASAPGGVLAELLAAAGTGMLLAVILFAIVNLLPGPRGSRGRRRREVSLEDRIAALSEMPEDRRRRALLSMMPPQDRVAWRAALYRPGVLPTIAEIETALREPGNRERAQ